MIKGFLTVLFLSQEPQNFTQEFQTLNDCKSTAFSITMKLLANPDVKGIAWTCEPAGSDA